MNTDAFAPDGASSRRDAAPGAGGKANRFAVVTGASSGIGLELARLCAQAGHDVLAAADEVAIHDVAQRLAEDTGACVEPLCCDLATEAGVTQLVEAVGAREIDALIANAGVGLGGAFLDLDFTGVRRVLDTNLTGTLDLLHRLGARMHARGAGRVLITGSIAGFQPGPFHAVYNASKAFVDSFAAAWRNELKDSGVTVTCLMPGATETAFFERAGLEDTKLGTMDKADPAKVANDGFQAMQAGEAAVISGFANKVQVAIAGVTPSSALAEAHRKLSEPGSGAR
jgi:short-subunit dehydrogenase